MRPFLLADLPELHSWHQARGLAPMPPEFLPAIGLIVPGSAAGFVRRMECNLTLIDSVTTNPARSSKERHKALELLWPELCRLAAQNSRLVLIYTQDKGIISRAERTGFQLRGAYFEMSFTPPLSTHRLYCPTHPSHAQTHGDMWCSICGAPLSIGDLVPITTNGK